MGDLLQLISAEWRVIGAAPLTFAALALLMAGVVYTAMRLHYRGRIETLDGRIKMRDDQIADYKNKLSGATPDEARARLDALQAQVNGLKPRQLGAAKRQQITAAVTYTKGVIEIASEMSCPDCQAFAGELCAAFSSGGWTIINPSFLGASTRASAGLGLMVANVSQLTPLESIVVAALNTSLISFDILFERGRPGPIGAGEPVPDVRLQVNAKVP